MKTDEIKKIFRSTDYGLSNGAYYFLLVVYLILLITLMFSCSKDEYDFDEFGGNLDETGWGVPLAHTKLDLFKIVADTGHVVVNEDKLISLVYKNEVSAPMLTGIIQIPEIEYSSDYTFEMPEYVPPGESVHMPYRQLIDFGSKDGMHIEQLNLSSCSIDLQIETDLNRNAALHISIPGAVKNSQSFETQISYLFSDPGLQPLQLNIDLSGYTVDFEQKNGGGTYLEVNFEVIMTNNEEPDLSPYRFSLKENISKVAFTAFKGYLGNIPLPISAGIISLDLFKNRLSGSIDFENPIIRFIAKNSLGIPLGIQFNRLQVCFKDGQFVNTDISGESIAQPWHILYPFDGSGKEMWSYLELNTANSNVADAFKNGPDILALNVLARTNPDAYPVMNYFSEASSLNLCTEIELPMYGVARNLTIQDIYAFNFNDFNQLKEAEFRINVTNAFPVDAMLQVYFTDKKKQVLDSLFVDEQWITRGSTNPQTFEVDQPSGSVLSSSFSEARLARITAETAAMYVKAVLNTPDNNPVKIFTDNYIDVQIAMRYTK